MTEEKQIEEMWKDIASTPIGTVKPDLTLTEMSEVYKGEFIGRIAKHLYNAGYRKAFDVAREIFEEIIELAKHSADEAKMRADKETNVLLRCELRGQEIGGNLMLYKLAELKKKYESEGAE